MRPKLSHWLRLIRWPNLLLITGCLVLVHYRLLQASLRNDRILPLEPAELVVLVLAILSTSCAGYLVNDLKDQHTDQINRPSRALIPAHISVAQVQVGLVIAVVVAGILSLGLAIHLHLLPWWLLYGGTVGALFYYAYRGKGQGMTGNILIALLTGLVPLIPLIPTLQLHWPLEVQESDIGYLFWFAGMAFGATWFRELVKDMEDIKGDTMGGWQTWVVVHGMASARWLATILGVATTFFIALAPVMWASTPGWPFLLIAGATLLLTAAVWVSSAPLHFHRISQGIKMVLLAGLLVLLLL